MAKVQFNCRLEKSIIERIDNEARRQAKALKRRFSQADVVTMLVGSASVMRANGKSSLTPHRNQGKERK